MTSAMEEETVESPSSTSVCCQLCECRVTGLSPSKMKLLSMIQERGLIVRCVMRGNSCRWFGRVDKLQKHVESCPHLFMTCPNGCGMVTKKDLEGHLKAKCPNVLVDCLYKWAGCKVRVQRKSLSEHVNHFSIQHNMLLEREIQVLRAENSLLKSEITSMKSDDEDTPRDGIRSDSDRSTTDDTLGKFELRVSPEPNSAGEDDNRAIEDGGLTMNVPNVTLLPSTTLVSMMSENEGAHVIEYMSKQDDGSFITTDQLGNRKRPRESSSIGSKKPSLSPSDIDNNDRQKTTATSNSKETCPVELCTMRRKSMSKAFIKCISCLQTYHVACVGLRYYQAKSLKAWYCWECDGTS